MLLSLSLSLILLLVVVVPLLHLLLLSPWLLLLLLRATKGACNPNLQVVITHAFHMTKNEWNAQNAIWSRASGPSITRSPITLVLTICHVKRKQSTFEQKPFDLRSLSPALLNLWLSLEYILTYYLFHINICSLSAGTSSDAFAPAGAVTNGYSTHAPGDVTLSRDKRLPGSPLPNVGLVRFKPSPEVVNLGPSTKGAIIPLNTIQFSQPAVPSVVAESTPSPSKQVVPVSSNRSRSSRKGIYRNLYWLSCHDDAFYREKCKIFCYFANWRWWLELLWNAIIFFGCLNLNFLLTFLF